MCVLYVCSVIVDEISECNERMPGEKSGRWQVYISEEVKVGRGEKTRKKGEEERKKKRKKRKGKKKKEMKNKERWRRGV